MIGIPRSLISRAGRQVKADLREDPYLPYILLLALALASFWFWHRIPNFATRDEKSRLFDVMVAYGQVLDDPSFESLKEGVLWGRVPFGATFYTFGLALLPVVLAAAVFGELSAFTSLGFPSYEFGFYAGWQSMPRWVWLWSIAFVRLVNVAFAVGCVYLTYRIGTAVRDRMTGNLSALLLTFTFGFLTIAHEGGEDMPATFFVLLALYLVFRYVQTDERALFLAGSAAGGVAIAFKLTAAPVILVIAVAYVLRVRRAGAEWRSALFRPGMLVGGALAGLLAIAVGFPTLLVGGIDDILHRFLEGSTTRATHTTGPDAPIWWWFLRGYFSGLSLPLFVAAVGGIVGSAYTLWKDSEDGDFDGTLLVFAGLALYILLFSQWHDFRVHHLLPTFPIIAILLAKPLLGLRDHRRKVAHVVIAVLLVTSGFYAVMGVSGYDSMPRDEAESWLAANADENDTMEVYRRDFQDAAVPFWMDVKHRFDDESGVGEDCAEFVQVTYRDLLYLKEWTYYRNGLVKERYITDLLRGEHEYEVAATFGPAPPRYVPERATPGSLTDLFRYGMVPQTDQYADEQELAANQFTVILERTGECNPSRNPPF